MAVLCWKTRTVCLLLPALCALVLPAELVRGAGALAARPAWVQAIAEVQPKMVKIYGAGGVSGLDPYQSGFLISADGQILTAWSYVLDTDHITATLNDGQKFEATLMGADPRMELAVLKIEAADLPHFDLAAAATADTGTRVLAFSNLFGVAAGDEPASVQHGTVAATTTLDARRGVFETPYRGPVYVLDAMTNNPGAAGGALTNQQGQLLGVLGKQLRSSLTNTWLNFAVPVEQFKASVEQIRGGKSRVADDERNAKHGGGFIPAQFGIVLVPDVLERTPPYVDTVRPGSGAAGSGLKADDLVVFVGDRLVNSCKAFREELARVEPDTEIKLVVMRGQDLVEVVLKPVEVEKKHK
jgi:S1-C subfamily serine protease